MTTINNCKTPSPSYAAEMSDNEYGDIDEDVWDEAEALTQASQTLPSNSPHRRKRRRISSDQELDNNDDDDDGSIARRYRSLDSILSDNDEGDEKKKSKYRIHLAAEEVPAAVIMGATQADGMPDSSPYRIRGPIYRIPRPPPSPELEPKSAPTLTSIFRPAKTQKQNSVPTPSLIYDFSKELEDLPSDAFSPSPPEKLMENRSIMINSSQPLEFTQSVRSQRLAAPQNGLRQTTLFGGRAPEQVPSATQAKKVHNYLVDKVPEPPTHHSLDQEAIKTWVYPNNLGPERRYQYTIVHKGLFNNLLVALPTGLGKTFIAATIMLNFFRWTKDSQIVFVAPTKPLVSQQVRACFEIAGIPRSSTTMLTGEQTPALRAEEWAEKRVFFMTPQTVENDLKTGIADPKKIALLVVDEAHRATGKYAYTNVVQFLRRFNQSFRVLALTATPGSTVEAVQEVIDNLEIAEVEIRTEESIDIKEYVHRRDITEILIEPSDEIIMIRELFSKALQPLVNSLCSQNAYYNKDPMGLTQFGMLTARKAWMASDAGKTANMNFKGMINALFTVLTSMGHAIKLLNFHGIGPFFSNIKDFRAEVEGNKKGGKYKNQIVNSPDFKKMMAQIQIWVNKEDFIGHPKLTHLCNTVLNHFLDSGAGLMGDNMPPSSTRVIVFAEYRDSAEDIARVLNRHGPMIRASVFVGQSDSKRSEGMNQEKQLETIRKFKAGGINVIVATSIGEEGLDIGEVDLIVCYDSSSSPIRMLQRMGRTGRKRAGKIVLLLMRGKEQDSYKKSKDNYEQMQKMISSGSRFTFRHDLSARIIPRGIKPEVDKRWIEIPPENTQDPSLPEPKRRAKAKKKPAKKFHMPDGVETGFRKASKLDSNVARPFTNFGITRKPSELNDDELTPVPLLDSILLSPKDMAELDRRFLKVPDGALEEVEMPDLTAQPVTQRSLTPTAKVLHGKYTRKCVNLFNTLSRSQVPEDRDIKPYGDEPPSDLGSIPLMLLEADIRGEFLKAPKASKPTQLPKPLKKAPKTTSRPKQTPASKKAGSKKAPARRNRPLQNDNSDSEDSTASMTMVSHLRSSQIPQPTPDSKEEGPGERVDRTSDMEELEASDDSDLGSLVDFIDPTQTQTQMQLTGTSKFSSSPPPMEEWDFDGRERRKMPGGMLARAVERDRANNTSFERTVPPMMQDSNDDDDLPTIEDLVKCDATTRNSEISLSSSAFGSGKKSTPNMFTRKRDGDVRGRGTKRRIVDSDDSDE
ncbi:3'-5' DNA helicase [Ciborinia camelliae]|nr:3'-5' DNA helicase [Ciborinia camelliae]